MVKAHIGRLIWERAPGLLAALVVALAIALATTHRQQPAAAGTVNVAVRLEDINPQVVKVGNPASALAEVETLSGYNPPVPPEDEGSLKYSYSWSATVMFSSTGAAGSYAAVNPGASTYSIKIDTPTSKSPKITITPHEPGFWQVTASCGVGVVDSKNPAKTWSGTGTTNVQTFISATVTFSPSPIITGADKNKPDSIFVPVTATVAPAAAVSDIHVNTYVQLPGGTGAAETLNATKNLATGTIKFDVAGKAGTAASMPNGDLKLEATGQPGNAVLGTDMVIVEIPKAIGNSVYTKYGGNGVTIPVHPTNLVMNDTTSPAAPGIPANEVGLFTGVQTVLSVPVVNQFGNALGAEYNGHEVYETINGGNKVGINTTLQNGSYDDPVGFYACANPIVEAAAGSALANKWLLPGSPQYQIASPQSESPTFSVTVAGFQLAPTVNSSSTVAIPGNRVVSYTAAGGGKLTVAWNAP